MERSVTVASKRTVILFTLFFVYISETSSLQTRNIYDDTTENPTYFEDPTPCQNSSECLQTYTPGIEHALDRNYSVVHEPFCENGICSCGKFCLSRSMTFENDEFYYCGECGRVGSSCNNSRCSHPAAVCKNDYCHCYSQGKFYEAYYCYIPYYGYEVALQMALTTCIIISICLLLGAIYNVLGTRRLRRFYAIREILRGTQNGTRESPPDDVPPKYDDVAGELPSYQEALKMTMRSQDNMEDGIDNLAFEDDTVLRTSMEIVPENEIRITKRKKPSTRIKSKSSENQPKHENNTNLEILNTGATGQSSNNPETLQATATVQSSKNLEKLNSDATGQSPCNPETLNSVAIGQSSKSLSDNDTEAVDKTTYTEEEKLSKQNVENTTSSIKMATNQDDPFDNIDNNNCRVDSKHMNKNYSSPTDVVSNDKPENNPQSELNPSRHTRAGSNKSNSPNTQEWTDDLEDKKLYNSKYKTNINDVQISLSENSKFKDNRDHIEESKTTETNRIELGLLNTTKTENGENANTSESKL